jgi:hypothetical protein
LVEGLVTEVRIGDSNGVLGWFHRGAGRCGWSSRSSWSSGGRLSCGLRGRLGGRSWSGRCGGTSTTGENQAEYHYSHYQDK